MGIKDILEIEKYKQLIDEYKLRIEVLEKTVKALVSAQKSLEVESGDEYMPQGEYYGIKFE